MTTAAEKKSSDNGAPVKEAKARVYKITVETFEQQVKTLEPEELFAMEHVIQVELESRRAAVAKLAEKLKPQPTVK